MSAELHAGFVASSLLPPEAIGGKTGSGDSRFKTFARGGRWLGPGRGPDRKDPGKLGSGFRFDALAAKLREHRAQDPQ